MTGAVGGGNPIVPCVTNRSRAHVGACHGLGGRGGVGVIGAGAVWEGIGRGVGRLK